MTVASRTAQRASARPYSRQMKPVCVWWRHWRVSRVGSTGGVIGGPTDRLVDQPTNEMKCNAHARTHQGVALARRRAQGDDHVAQLDRQVREAVDEEPDERYLLG